MIPKILHYCWFGPHSKSPINKKCMATWPIYLKNYAAYEWTESTFNINNHPYTKAAYESGYFAFVSDYVRLWALYKYGGIYLDTDMMLYKPLDKFLRHRAFGGHEIDVEVGYLGRKELLFMTALIGAEPGHPWIKMLLDWYDNAERTGYPRYFDINNLKPNTQIVTKLSLPLVERAENGTRYLRDGVVIYPNETFCPYEFRGRGALPTENSYACHMFSNSWQGGIKV